MSDVLSQEANKENKASNLTGKEARFLINFLKPFVLSILVFILLFGVIRILLFNKVEEMNSLVLPGLEPYTFQLKFGWIFEWWGRYQSGNLKSIGIVTELPVQDLIGPKSALTQELILYTVPGSLVLGIPIGVAWGKGSKKPISLLLRNVAIVLVVLIPLVTSIWFQYHFAVEEDLYPIIGMKTPGYPDPSRSITGYRLIDSLLSAQMDLYYDTLWHLILPLNTMIIPMLGIVIWITRGVTRDIQVNEFFANKWIIRGLISFIAIILIAISVEIIYNLRGIGILFVNAFYFDYPVLITILIKFGFGLIIFYILWSLVAHSIEFSNNPSRNRGESYYNAYSEVQRKPKKIFPIISISLGGIILASIILYFILISPLLTNRTELFSTFYPNAYEAPSPDHVWGTGQYGRDILSSTNWNILGFLANVGIISGFSLLFSGIFLLSYSAVKGSIKKESWANLFGDLFKDLCLFGAIFFGFLAIFLLKIRNYFYEADRSVDFIVKNPLFYLLIGIFGGCVIFLLSNDSIPHRSSSDRLKQAIIQQIPTLISNTISFSIFFMLFYETLSFFGLGVQKFTIGSEISYHMSALIYAPWASCVPMLVLLITGIAVMWSISSLEFGINKLTKNTRSLENLPVRK
jgi:ABC-type dipeptide/oligopeptide/nickel transport system permease component